MELKHVTFFVVVDCLNFVSCGEIKLCVSSSEIKSLLHLSIVTHQMLICRTHHFPPHSRSIPDTPPSLTIPHPPYRSHLDLEHGAEAGALRIQTEQSSPAPVRGRGAALPDTLASPPTPATNGREGCKRGKYVMGS